MEIKFYLSDDDFYNAHKNISNNPVWQIVFMLKHSPHVSVSFGTYSNMDHIIRINLARLHRRSINPIKHITTCICHEYLHGFLFDEEIDIDLHEDVIDSIIYYIYGGYDE